MSVKILAIPTEGVRRFPRFLQANSGMLPPLQHKRPLSNSSFISHPTNLCYTVMLEVSLNNPRKRERDTIYH